MSKDLTVKDLKAFLAKFKEDAIITNEQNESIVHLRSKGSDIIISTVRPIGECNRTGMKVYPSIVEGYSAFCPELDEDLTAIEYLKL